MNTAIIPNIYSVIGSFLLVIALLIGALFFLRKVYGFKPGRKLNDKRINIVEIVPLSQRQKIILCNVNDQEILLAVSGQSITSLAHWVTKKSLSGTEIEQKEKLVTKSFGEEKIIDTKNSLSRNDDTKKKLKNKIPQFNNSTSSTKTNDALEKTKAQISDTNDLLHLAKEINKSIKKNILENTQ